MRYVSNISKVKVKYQELVDKINYLSKIFDLN